MKIIGEKQNQNEFRNYVDLYNFGSIPPTSLVVHHTFIPKKNDWSGKSSLIAIKNYYEAKGWNAGPHIFVGEDGIWLFTPMYEVGIHAGKGNATYSWGRLKEYSIGIEVVGNYDTERWSGKTKSNALTVIRILKEKLNLENNDIKFHRDFSDKSCPGAAITKEWLFKELNKRDAHNSRIAQNLNVVSNWARDGFQWQIEHDFDRYVHPHQKVEAEWVFAILKKYHDKFYS